MIRLDKEPRTKSLAPIEPDYTRTLVIKYEFMHRDGNSDHQSAHFRAGDIEDVKTFCRNACNKAKANGFRGVWCEVSQDKNIYYICKQMFTGGEL